MIQSDPLLQAKVVITEYYGKLTLIDYSTATVINFKNRSTVYTQLLFCPVIY